MINKHHGNRDKWGERGEVRKRIKETEYLDIKMRKSKIEAEYSYTT